MKTKLCFKCKRVLPISLFSVNRHRSGGRAAFCHNCRRRYSREYYYRHRDEHNAKRYISKKKWRAQIRLYLDELKSVPCKDCKETYIPYAMDFDHVRGKKKFTICYATRNQFPINKLKKELAKCDIVCANCHRLRTFKKRGGSWRQ